MVYASGRDVTQELLAERALASSESRYRTLVDGLPDTAVFLVDRDLRVEFAAGQPLHDGDDHPGRADRAARRRDPAQPESTALVDACSAALAGDERSLDIVSADHGHALWLRTSPLPGDEPGQIVGAMLIVQDIRGRVEREREIERRPGALPPGLRGRADRHGGRRRSTGASSRSTRRSARSPATRADELTGTTFSRITHPDDLGVDLEVDARR